MLIFVISFIFSPKTHLLGLYEQSTDVYGTYSEPNVILGDTERYRAYKQQLSVCFEC